MTASAIGRRIERLRKQRQWSQYTLADKAGVSRQHLRRVESGACDPTIGMVTKLGRALGVTLVDLVK